MNAKPTKPGPSDKRTATRQKRAAAQKRRRAMDRVTESDTYEVALARLREAFEVTGSEAAPSAPTATPPAPAASLTPSPSENPPPASPEAPPTAPAEVKPASPPDVKPAGEASPPEAKPEAAEEADPDLFSLTPEEGTAALVGMVDALATKFLAAPELSDKQRAQLEKDTLPVLRKAMAKSDLKAIPPELALLGTVAAIYGPVMWANYEAHGSPLAPPGSPRS